MTAPPPLTKLPGGRPAGDPDPAKTETITIGGRTFKAGHRTARHLERTFKQFDRQRPHATLSIRQPCYNVGVEESKGTHDGDGVIDFVVSGVEWRKAEKFLRKRGWAAWWRHTGKWEDESQWHLHAVSLGCPGPVGGFVPAQVDDYHNKAFGLKDQHGRGIDDTWHPDDIPATVFDYPKFMAKQGVPEHA
jgi:hypothetical protein